MPSTQFFLRSTEKGRTRACRQVQPVNFSHPKTGRQGKRNNTHTTCPIRNKKKSPTEAFSIPRFPLRWSFGFVHRQVGSLVSAGLYLFLFCLCGLCVAWTDGTGWGDTRDRRRISAVLQKRDKECKRQNASCC